MTPTVKEQLIKERMKSINVEHRSYFIRNENNVRFSHIEGGEYKYIVFPFCDSKALIQVAQLLKDSRIVDGFRVEQLSENQFYVVLLRHKLVRHVDATGVPEYERITTVVEWSELRITRKDAQEVIARFELSQSEPPTTPRSTPAISMYAYKTGVMKMPVNNPIFKRA